MSTDFSIRPVGIPAPAPIITTSSPAANDAVQTELPAIQTVTASDAGASARSSDVVHSQDVTRQVVFDQAAASFVFQIVNDKTNSVLTQFPDEAMLRRRAYFHALDLSKSDQVPPVTDRNA
ncbi:hypothetical protein [Bradyrhizobium sp.]|uniref:hypothetical protein n=1 Tax=Bradyrhizobium sp. TaxID=376 RepID=UPI002384B41A|nr:hypothetical protein [Bradyrhizobium sp.]MDE2379840.1 hypothetical protein [Bradyrhizobium sp.]